MEEFTVQAAPSAMVEHTQAAHIQAVSSPDDLNRRLAELRQIIQGYLVEREDYGIIPGTKKPTLYKSGAEKLLDVYGLTPTYHIDRCLEDWDKPLFHYIVSCTLTSRSSGNVIAQGFGACNSKEARYADRWIADWAAKKDGVDTTGLPSRDKTNRYGPYKEYKISNDDPFTLVNTLVKMAKKRALVDAVLTATRSSGLFTQDMEDLAATSDRDDGDEKPVPIKAGGQGLAVGLPHLSKPVGVPFAKAKPQSAPDPSADSGPAKPEQVLAVYRICEIMFGMDRDTTESVCQSEYGAAPEQMTQEVAARAIRELQKKGN